MKSLIKTILCLFFYSTVSGQDISGNWNWNFKEKHSTEITLKQVNSNEYKGNYCSSYFNGMKIDCNENKNDYCVFLNKTGNNTFTGTFESNYSKSIGTIKVEYIPSLNKIKIIILTEPDGEFYFPNNVMFEK
jgi:hypothetical protein